jgi:hypothetical protein
MQNLLLSLDKVNRRVLEDAADRERARLPLFPGCLGEGLNCSASISVTELGKSAPKPPCRACNPDRRNYRQRETVK